jgi:chaperonin GroEL
VALQGGILPGGGVALLSAAEYMLDNFDLNVGQMVFVEAIKKPFDTICANKGVDKDEVYDNINLEEFGHGWNAATDEYGNMIEMGVIDPALVPVIAIDNAVSVASAIITSSFLIVNNS